MDTTLVTVTLLSLAMAAGLSVIVWRMLRDERHRSDARVLALTARARTAEPAPRTSSSAPRASQLAPRDHDLVLREAPMSATVASAPLFVERKVASPWGTRFAVMAGLGLVVASGILFALTITNRTAAARQGGRPAVTAAAAQTATNPGVAGLELLSLRDTRQPGSLTITGLVQNPRGGAALSRVTVTAYAFDDQGAFLASGRASIELAALAPGDESPFVVSVPVTETVARYRIGFRGEDGKVIAHIDKRQQAPVAALRQGSGPANW